jgi:hypothetical protein
MRANNEPPTTAPANFVLVAKRELKLGGVLYPCGAQIPVSACGRNFEAMLNNRSIAWTLPSDRPTPTARVLPTSPPPVPKPKVEIILVGDDVVASRAATKAAMTEKCGGDSARALDLLMGDPGARDLWKCADRVECEREAQRRKVISISPDQLPVLL